jgi:hypothetical protein
VVAATATARRRCIDLLRLEKFQENAGPFVVLMLIVFGATLVVSLLGQLVLLPCSGVTAAAASQHDRLLRGVRPAVRRGVLPPGRRLPRRAQRDPGIKPEVSMLTDDAHGELRAAVVLVGLGAFVGYLLCFIPIIWPVFTTRPIIAWTRAWVQRHDQAEHRLVKFNKQGVPDPARRTCFSSASCCAASACWPPARSR